MRGRAFSVRGVRNPPVTACGGASPLWQGGLWSGDGPASAEKPPCPKNCLPAPSSAPCGGRAFSVREVRNPPVTASGGASPLWQGGLWSGDGPASAEKPPCPKNCLPAPSSAPCGGGPFQSGGRNPPVTACGAASPLWQGGLWSGDGPASAEKPPLP